LIRPPNSKVANVASDAVLPTWKLRERHVGKFERSFTFSSRIQPSGMKTSLDAGLLSIVLPKDREQDAKEAAKSEIEYEEK
jgi:HSP20 family molecular chaperone IbpA